VAGRWEESSMFAGSIKAGKFLDKLCSSSKLSSSERRICKDVSSFALIGRI
jgi:hypothetical protein